MENNMTTYEDKTIQPMTLKDWLLTLLVMIIPVVNLVMMFVWAFGSNVNKSKKTYFQAVLIATAIITVLYIILGAALFSALGSMAY